MSNFIEIKPRKFVNLDKVLCVFIEKRENGYFVEFTIGGSATIEVTEVWDCEIKALQKKLRNEK